MKAKEYINKHLTTITRDTTRDELSAKLVDCYEEFSKEVYPAVSKLKHIPSIKSKLIEFDKKWRAIANGLKDRVGPLQVDRTEDRDRGDRPIDAIDIDVTPELFKAMLPPELQNLLTPTAIDRGDCLTDKQIAERNALASGLTLLERIEKGRLNLLTSLFRDY